MNVASPLREDDVVAAIRAIAEPENRNGRILLGIGDDAALWQPSRSHRSAITTDLCVEGVHFTRALMSLEDAGWRSMSANASDLAAMGARPLLATVALGIPGDAGVAAILELYRGLAASAREAKLAIVGGDLSRAPGWSIGIAAVGEVRPSNAKQRDGARPGDVLAVTGPLGAARAGLELARAPGLLDGDAAEAALRAFRRPRARCSEGRFLAASRNVVAMIDCSDGLSTDLDRLCTASGCGAEVQSVPVAACARDAAGALGVEAEGFALAGGEDFELLAAVRPRAFRHVALRFHARFGRELHPIGRAVATGGLTWRGQPLERSGWDHFAP